MAKGSRTGGAENPDGNNLDRQIQFMSNLPDSADGQPQEDAGNTVQANTPAVQVDDHLWDIFHHLQAESRYFAGRIVFDPPYPNTAANKC